MCTEMLHAGLLVLATIFFTYKKSGSEQLKKEGYSSLLLVFFSQKIVIVD